MSGIIPFVFDGHAVRTLNIDGEAGFVGKDVCDRLGYADATNAMKQHCKGVVKRHPLQTPGGLQEVRILGEADVLRLIVRSKLPEAERFERWVFEEVLPAIRRDGGYIAAAPDESPEELALRALTVLQATVERQKLQLAIAEPKAEAFDRLATADGSFCITDAAKNLQVPPKDLFKFLERSGWIYRRVGNEGWLAYQTHIVNGDMEHKVTTVHRMDGTEKVISQCRVTPQGMAKLAKKLGPPKASLVA